MSSTEKKHNRKQILISFRWMVLSNCCLSLSLDRLYTHAPRVPEALSRFISYFYKEWFLFYTIVLRLLLKFLILKVVDFPILVTMINLKFLIWYGGRSIYLVIILDDVTLWAKYIFCHRELDILILSKCGLLLPSKDNLFLNLPSFLFWFTSGFFL